MIKEKIKSGYKSSPLGLIPIAWEVKKLCDVSEIRGGFAFDSKGFVSSGKYQIIKMSNLYENNLNLQRSQSFLNTISLQENEYLLKKGDILMTLTGTVGKKDYGFSYQIQEEKNLLLNQRVAKITVNSIHSLYLFYEIKTSRFLNQFFYTSRGGTGNQANVGTSDLSNIKIAFPPKFEQIRIANAINTWDNAIQTTTQLIAQKEQRKKWLLQQLLSGKKRLKGFEKEKWKKYTFDDLLKIVKRPVEWDDNELYNLISVRRRSGGIFAREALLGNQILVKDLRTAIEGDFLFSKMQILHGASALVTKEFDGAKISGSYIATVAKNSKILNIEYFNWYSKSPYFYHQTYISSYGVHIEKMTFDWNSFVGLDMKLPSIQEQNAISKVLKSADKEIILLQNKLTQLKEQKKGLMQILLTGKKRLKIK